MSIVSIRRGVLSIRAFHDYANDYYYTNAYVYLPINFLADGYHLTSCSIGWCNFLIFVFRTVSDSAEKFECKLCPVRDKH